MKSSKDLDHKSSTIYYWASLIVRNDYKFFEVWNMKMIERLHSIFIFRIVSYFSQSVKYIYASFGIKGVISDHCNAVLTSSTNSPPHKNPCILIGNFTDWDIFSDSSTYSEVTIRITTYFGTAKTNHLISTLAPLSHNILRSICSLFSLEHK